MPAERLLREGVIGETVDAAIAGHVTNKKNPHEVTAEQVDAYNKQAVDDALGQKSASGHDHDDVYPAGDPLEAQDGYVWTYDSVSGGWIPGAPITNHTDLEGLGADGHQQYALADGTRGAFATPGHKHAGADITSGTVPIEQIGTGTKDATTYLRGDGSFAVPPAPAGATPQIRLDYMSTTDIASGVALPAGTWKDIGPQHSFSLVSGQSGTEIIIGGFILVGSTDSTYYCQMLLDGVTPIPVGGNSNTGTSFINVIVGNIPIWRSGLASGGHTLKVQVKCNANSNAYCRPVSKDGEVLTVQVIEHA